MATKKTGLGRGLSAILPDVEQTIGRIDEAAVRGDAVEQIALDRIDPNRDQPRRAFDPEALQGLANSIHQSGILQPLLLARDGRRYTIIAGERRWRAARLAGLTAVPAIVRDWDEVRRQEAALIENIQREDLNPIEEAEGIRRLMDECALTQETVAERLGRSRPAVANLLRLLTLPEDMRASLISGALSAGHGRVLAGVDDAARQRALYERAIAEGWSVRRLEEEARRAPEKKADPAKKPAPLPPEYGELCDRLRRATGLKAAIEGTETRGRVVLQYASQEELQRLWDLLERGE